MTITRIFPKSALGRNKVDEAFQKEATEVPYALWDSDVQDFIRGTPGSTYLYRGWILQPREYSNMEARAHSEGSTLFESYEDYIKSQFITGWFNDLQDHTPKTIISDRHFSFEDLRSQTEQLEFPIVVKGVSKSLKDQWNAGMFIPDIGSFDQVVEYFLAHTNHREGIVFRQFERWEGAELRTWWVKGQLKSIEPHPDFVKVNTKISDTDITEISESFSEAIKSLNTSFITADVVKNKKGKWRIIECGSGSVSQTVTGEILSLI